MTGKTVDLKLPAKLDGLFKPCRYKVMYGGRGGGKSHGAASALLALGAQRPLRILCVREIQKSMRDTVHRLLKDKVAQLGLGHFYEITDFEIRGANGTLFVFSGLQSHTVDSIKSFEGIDIVWVEEGHGVSKKSWDVLTPTIRKEGSEIWITLNPDMETDETYRRFIAMPSEDTWLCEINWRDNPWFPEALNRERLKAQRSMNKEDYGNIWEGMPRMVSEGAVYRHEIQDAFHSGRVTLVPYDSSLPVHTVWDLGWNDAMTIGLVQRDLTSVRIIGYIEDTHRTLDWYVAELEKLPYRWGTDFLPHDGRTRNFQTGKSTMEILTGLGRKSVFVQNATGIEEGIRAARMLFPKVYFDKDKTARLLECLKRYDRQIHAKTGVAMGPLHDEYSHGADMFRYLAQAVDLMDTGSNTGYTETPVSDWRLY
ncbi:PBSX family phage terminase large subunit [Neisseria gonorrhoeae]|uniref:PBSX family phage terminase large subunit n=1 Tax=Neisseria gonorrhoeae TaxID=485 RepID=UPI0017818DBD|nr:PBSX family phage terminase large subunit [Neisseria gonorrhoeae]QOG52114.1 PBSX family phage terminase large subunit [Neisseria gonorrhoeae]